MKNKATTNYWIDMVIGLALVVSAVSGMIFLFPTVMANGSLFGLSVLAWSDLLSSSSLLAISSLIMIGGVVAHLLLHARWLKTMTKRIFAPREVAPAMVAVRNESGRG